MTTKAEIAEWFDEGVRQGATYLIVVCDTYDHEDYPAYVKPNQDFWKEYAQYTRNMQRVMEVYDLSQLKQAQLNEHRADHCPPRV